jgi:hypothetical protein
VKKEQSSSLTLDEGILIAAWAAAGSAASFASGGRAGGAAPPAAQRAKFACWLAAAGQPRAMRRCRRFGFASSVVGGQSEEAATKRGCLLATGAAAKRLMLGAGLCLAAPSAL